MRTRPIAVLSSVVALVVLAVGLVAAPAAQAAAYRYWTYWQGSVSGWTFATAGPATTVPVDGSVEGWRFAVTTQAGRPGDAPATAPSFESICGGTAPQDGLKRVALVVDPGPPGIAPSGQAPPPLTTACVMADPDATGYQVLRAEVTVRTDGGLICGIGDYPTGECAPVIDEADLATRAASADPPSGPAPDSTSVDVAGAAASAMPVAASVTGGESGGAGTPLATIAVAVLLLAFAAAGAVRYRRDRNPDDHG